MNLTILENLISMQQQQKKAEQSGFELTGKYFKVSNKSNKIGY